MATSLRVSDDPEVARHYATQVGLTAALVASLRRLWPTLDLGDTQASLPRYKAGVRAVVDQFSSASISLNADHFDAMRDAAGISTPFRTPVIDTPPAAKVDAGTGWAVSPLFGGDTMTTTVEADVQVRVEGAAQKSVMDAGRNELIAAIEADREARGYARVTKPGACAFCMMLATRGAAYKNEHTAGRNANTKFVGDGEFKYHDNCHCTIQPLFGKHYEPPAHIREAQALYKAATAGRGDKLNAFRRAYERGL